MAFFKGSGYYHVGSTNTNRQVTYLVASGVANAFVMLKGNNAFHPWIGAIANPSTNQKIAQFRVDYVARYLSIYAILVGINIPPTTGGQANSAVELTYENYVSNSIPTPADITDTLGMADRPAKTKDGLSTLATDLIATASLDGGVTLLFAANPALADGTVSTAAAITALTITRLTPSMY